MVFILILYNRFKIEKNMLGRARIISFLILAISLIGCSTIKYVPVETVKIDTTYISQVKIDSVYQRDSIYLLQKGDTVYLTKYMYKYKYIQNHDTIFKYKSDTIQIPYPIEAQLTKWQKAKMNMGECFLIVIIIVVIIFCVKIFVSRKQW